MKQLLSSYSLIRIVPDERSWDSVTKVIEYFRQKSPLPLKYGDIIFNYEGKHKSSKIYAFDGQSFLPLLNFPIHGFGQVLPKQFVCFGLSRFRQPDYFLPLLGIDNQEQIEEAESKMLKFKSILGFPGWMSRLVWFRLHRFLDQVRANITINSSKAYFSKYAYKKTFFEYEIESNGKKHVKKIYLLQDFIATEPDQFDTLISQIQPNDLLWGEYRTTRCIQAPNDQEFISIQLESTLTDHPSTGKKITSPWFNPTYHLYPSGDVVPKLRDRSFTVTWNSFVPVNVNLIKNQVKFVILPTDVDNILQDLKQRNLPLQKGDLVNLVFAKSGDELNFKELSVLTKVYQREIRQIKTFEEADFNLLIFDGEKLVFPSITPHPEGNYPPQFLCFEQEYFEPDYFITEFHPDRFYFYSNPDLAKAKDTSGFARRLIWFRPHQFLDQLKANLYTRQDGRQASFFLSKGKRFDLIDNTVGKNLFEQFHPLSNQVYAAYYNDAFDDVSNMAEFPSNLYIRNNSYIEL